MKWPVKEETSPCRFHVTRICLRGSSATARAKKLTLSGLDFVEGDLERHRMPMMADDTFKCAILNAVRLTRHGAY